MDKFYILEKRKLLDQVYKIISLEDINIVLDMIDDIEKETSTVIVYMKNIDDINTLNNYIFNSFFKKNIKLNKFWITEEAINKLGITSVNNIYNQEAVKYKFYTKVLKKDDYIFVVGTTLSDINEIIKKINKFIVFISIFSIFINWLLVNINIGIITRHIKNIKYLLRDIASLNFRTEGIKTCDEIEDLSRSINHMSNSLRKAHEEINSQNFRLKELLSNVAHEIKTPLSIIKAYVQGIEDGFDDGTYLDIVYDEIGKIDGLIENLLLWFKIEREDKKERKIDLLKKLDEILDKYRLIFQENDISISFRYSQNDVFNILINDDHLDIILENLLTNAIKYTSDKKIDIVLLKEGNSIKFEITNGVRNLDKDIDKIWVPFYVGDISRDKNFSGTGLGLSIVREILNRYKLPFNVKLEDNKFKFYIYFS